VGTAKRQLTADEVAELRVMHANGCSRNQAARRFNTGMGTMTRICSELDPPIVWDRRATLSAAVEMHTLDLRNRRARAADDAMTEAETLIGRIGSPMLLRQLGSAGDGLPAKWHETTLPRPDARAAKDLAQAAATLAGLSMRLVDFDKATGGDVDDAIGRLGDLSGNLTEIARALGAELPDSDLSKDPSIDSDARSTTKP
jgi:hypothetical protein